jgi:hypothetical protein
MTDRKTSAKQILHFVQDDKTYSDEKIYIDYKTYVTGFRDRTLAGH